MLSEVLCTANDGLGALEATTSHAWSVVMGAQAVIDFLAQAALSSSLIQAQAGVPRINCLRIW